MWQDAGKAGVSAAHASGCEATARRDHFRSVNCASARATGLAGMDATLALSALGPAASVRLGRPPSGLEAHRARKAAPVPRNIGCPYATLYCENYW